jgi:16S rRNA (guanine966-N2)-methyltransferase
MSRMRIIAGRLGGQTLRALAGEVTRPTAERVREAWASTIGSLLPEGFARLRVLDAFAGSGALGLEALSRGAAHATFCERDRRALVVLKENLDALVGTGGSGTGGSGTSGSGAGGSGTDDTDADGATTLLSVDAFAPSTLKLLKQAGPYDLVILDPPYACAAGRLKTLLGGLARVGALSTDALVTYERSRDAGEGLNGSVLCAAYFPASLQMLSCKTYGTTRVEYLRYH